MNIVYKHILLLAWIGYVGNMLHNRVAFNNGFIFIGLLNIIVIVAFLCQRRRTVFMYNEFK